MLEHFLDSDKIPSIKKQSKTFLEIAKQPHYENVISNIYAFYFDPYEEHGLGHLFIDAFRDCIKDKVQNQNGFSTELLEGFYEFVVETEYGTNDRGRIDIFLYNDNQGIIIENKIYHHLANNLSDYIKTAEDRVGENKNIGVLLTLTPHKGRVHPQFVNILHIDFLSRVMANIGHLLVEASEKYVTFLKDLYQNIENMSTKEMSDRDFEFYLKNQDKILDAVEFNNRVKDYIKSQVERAWNKQRDILVDEATKNTYQYYSYLVATKEGVDDIFFCMWFDKLLSGQKEIWINIYLTGDNIKKYFSTRPQSKQTKDYRQSIHKIVKSYSEYKIELYSEQKKNTGWMYVAGKTYNLNDHQIMNLQDTIGELIKEDRFIDLFDKLTECLK